MSDNGDRNKILATVDAYTKRYPDRWVIFKGSTVERNRLYRMAVGLHFEELSSKFEIFAFANDNVVPFVKNMKINAFLIKRKIL